MALTLTKEPFKYSFVGNRNTFDFHADIVESTGSKTSAMFNLLGVGALNDYLAITVNGLEIKFYHSDKDGDYNFMTLRDLEQCILNCYYISTVFSISTRYEGVPIPKLNIIYNAIRNGEDTISMAFYHADGTKYPDSSFIAILSYIQGSPIVVKPNYGVAVAFDVESNDSNLVEQSQTQFVVYDPDALGNVQIPIDIVKGYFPKPGIPLEADGVVTELPNALVKYRINYAEYFGDVPRLQSMNTTNYFYALNGELVKSYGELNVPDWNDLFSDAQISNFNHLRIIGEDTDKTVFIYNDQHEFLYALFNDSNTDAQDIHIKTIANYSDGTTTENVVDWSLESNKIYRLAVHPSLLGVVDAQSYTLIISDDLGTIFTRYYVVSPRPFMMHEFLLQNKYGLLTTFVCYKMVHSSLFSADFVSKENQRLTNITSKEQSYLVTSPFLSKFDAEKIATSFANGNAFYFVKGVWKSITIKPGEISPSNESTEMVQISFEFSFTENQIANIQGSNVRVSDITTTLETNDGTLDQYVASEQHIANPKNQIV